MKKQKKKALVLGIIVIVILFMNACRYGSTYFLGDKGDAKLYVRNQRWFLNFDHFTLILPTKPLDKKGKYEFNIDSLTETEPFLMIRIMSDYQLVDNEDDGYVSINKENFSNCIINIQIRDAKDTEFMNRDIICKDFSWNTDFEAKLEGDRDKRYSINNFLGHLAVVDLENAKWWSYSDLGQSFKIVITVKVPSNGIGDSFTIYGHSIAPPQKWSKYPKK